MRSSLPDVDRALLDWLVLSLRGDRAGSFLAMQRVVELAPAAELAVLQLATEATENGDPARAVELFHGMRRSPAFDDGWLAYHANRAEALHTLGRHAQELRELAAVLQRHPQLHVLHGYELRARAALRDSVALWRGMEVLSETTVAPGQDAPLIMRQVALELGAHGDANGARRALAMAHQWYLQRAAADSGSQKYRLGLARVAYLQDDRPLARRLYQGLLQDLPSCVVCRGALGVLAARDSNYAEVQRIDRDLMQLSERYLFGAHIAWRARMASALGNGSRAQQLLAVAHAEGLENDIMDHTDVDLHALVRHVATKGSMPIGSLSPHGSIQRRIPTNG